MATRKYLSLERLTEYDALIKSKIDTSDASTLESAKSYADTKVSGITSGDIIVKEAEHADSADSATSSLDAEKLGGQLPDYYAKASDIPTGSLANKNSVSESDLDSALAEKVNAASEGNHSHANKTVLDGITAAKVSAWDSAEANAKAYADTAASNAATAVKNDLLNGAGAAYDTLKELGDLIDDNKDAIDALEDIASGKADATHGHAISDVSGLQSALDGKAASSHGTHVTFDSTNKPKMDGTAAFGTSTSVARADHVHPTDTSRASKTEFDTHVSDTTKHITSTERTNWGAAYTHSTSAHAPSNAQANVIESIKVNGTTQTITSKSVNIIVPTDNSQLANGAGYITSTAIANKADKATTLSGYGITDAYTKTQVDGIANGKAASSHKHTVADITNLTASVDELNYVDGVTSNIQTQLDTKATTSALNTHVNNADIHFTAAERTKLSGIATGATKVTVDSALSSSSTNPVQNKVVNSAIATATSAITANTNSISTHTSQISALQTAVSEIQEITSEEIANLFK